MADRTTKVTLTASVANYLNGMDAAARATRSFADGSKAKLDAQRDAMNRVGTTFLAVGALAAAGVVLATKAFSDFDAKMSQVKTLSHATADEMDGLTVAALNMGQKIGFSAGEVADAEIELVKAGVSVKDIMGGALQGALQLAAAGQIKVSDATEIATIALTQFNLKGKDVPHVADLLAAGADKALGGVSDLGEALKSGGLVADQFGLSLDETVGTLSAFANAGLLGETAGTDLRQMLLKLASPSAEATATMKSLGISIYDASGKFVGMSNLAGQLADKLGKKSEADRNAAEATIFGARAIAGANVLYKEGAKGIGDWISKVDDTGFAAQQAKGKMDNLQGDLKKLGAAFQTDLIQTGSTANGVLRGATQTVTNLVSAFGALPKPAQGAILAVGAVVAGMGLVGGAALTAVPKFAAFKNGLDDLKISMRTVGVTGGGVALAITGLVTVLAAVANSQAEAKQRTDDLAASLDQATGAITKNTRAVAAKQLHDNGSIEIANKLGVSLSTLTDAALGNAAAVGKISDQQQAWLKSGKGSQAEMTQQGILWQKLEKNVGGMSGSLKDAQRDTKNTAKAMDDGSKTTQTAAEAYQSAADKAKSLDDAISNLTDEINKANGVGQDAVTANANYQKALADADDTIKKAQQHVKGYSMGIDENTTAGSANAAMLAGLAQSAEDAALKQYKLDGNTADYQKRLEASHQAVYDRAIALGATAEQAQNLADKVAAIPTKKDIQVLVDGEQAAKAAIDRTQKAINSLTGKTVMIYAQADISAASRSIANAMQQANSYATGAAYRRAGGGPVYGPGTSTSDSVLLHASNGEFVINADAYARNKALVEAINSGASSFSSPRFTPTPQRYAPQNTSAAPVNVSPVVSLQGATLVMSVDGRQMTAVIQEQIVRADSASARRIKGGMR